MTTHNETFPVHSPLGASSMERWENCPGSNVMLKTLNMPASDDDDWRIEGSAAHEAGAHCLINDLEAYEVLGMTFEGFEIDAPTAIAVQEYLDYCASVVKGMERELVDLGLDNDIQVFTEVRVSGDFHEKFYGTADRVTVSENLGRLEVIDYKHGVGIAVDAVNNPQLKYYGLGMSLKYPKVTEVVLTISQPRAFHVEGPLRSWSTTANELEQWKDDTLIPAMARAEFDTSLSPGDWCRFCPAKLACPLLTGLFGAASTADQQAIPSMSNQTLALNYQQKASVKHYMNALDKEVYSRLNRGVDVPNFKLVYKRANRVWKSSAKAAFEEKFGEDAFITRELKSPSKMGAINSAASKLVNEHAFTPTTGLTVAPLTDSKPGVKIETAAKTFDHMTDDVT